MKVKKEFVNLDSHISNSRKVKRLKAHKDRLLDALRELTNATHNASSLTDEQKTALDKAVIALQYHHHDSNRHDSGL